VIEGNSFRNVAGSGATHRAIYVDNQSASVRQNVAWQKAGTTFGYQCNTAAGAAVYVDGVAEAAGDHLFTGSNIIVPAGA
jgi:hypothetical protein